jgi:hypothetical protein
VAFLILLVAICSALATQLSDTDLIQFSAFTILRTSFAQPTQDVNSGTTGDSQMNETTTGDITDTQTNTSDTGPDGSLINNTQGATAPDASLREEPDDDCLFNPSLPKCAPIEGKCPSGFLMNENEQCFPDKPCPAGFTKIDEDETGTCYPVGHPTPLVSDGENNDSAFNSTLR